MSLEHAQRQPISFIFGAILRRFRSFLQGAVYSCDLGGVVLCWSSATKAPLRRFAVGGQITSIVYADGALWLGLTAGVMRVNPNADADAGPATSTVVPNDFDIISDHVSRASQIHVIPHGLSIPYSLLLLSPRVTHPVPIFVGCGVVL